jgi:glucosamine-6-phosphate deaminase
MKITIFSTEKELGKAAAELGGSILMDAINRKGKATFVAATGSSQFEFLEQLISISSIDWSKTTMFHLDEYIGIPETHKASFRKYLKERLIDKVHPRRVYLINGNANDPKVECDRLGEIISKEEIDVSFVGIGENGHLAFNDPPADFETDRPYIIVKLNEDCKNQQVKEGWFEKISDVPDMAISMSIKQILKSKTIICSVPGERKARAVKCALEGNISPYCPASVLRTHNNVYLFLDEGSAKLLVERKKEFYI